MDIEKVKSDLVMRRLFFPECSVNRAVDIVSEHISVDIAKSIECIGDGEYDVTVTVNVTKAANDLQVHVVAKATFFYDNPDKGLVKKIVEMNTVAIMFPFIRSQVSLLTTQPGLTPIILPPINTAKLN